MKKYTLFFPAAAVAALVALLVQAAPADEAAKPLGGTVKAYRSSYLNARTIGNVSVIYVDEGQFVEKGQPLLQMDDTLEQANYNLAKSQSEDKTALEAAEAFRDQRKRELDRNEKLWKKGTIEKASYEVVKYAYTAADIDVRAKQAHLDQLADLAAYRKAAADQYEVRAPFAGIIVEKLIEVGETTYPLDKRLFHLVDISKVYVEVYPDITFLKKIKVGLPVRVTTELYPQKEFHGRVSSISVSTEIGGENFGFKVLADNPDGLLLPEMKASVTIEAGKESVQAPAAAPEKGEEEDAETPQKAEEPAE
ncbi:MAG: efflux RND transporter periplasmic adaptor subunit [Planctomycetes bacterium]|nr:efflux RND transporter periplasmic adaptor subunit [Planctomycetota bacterium]